MKTFIYITIITLFITSCGQEESTMSKNKDSSSHTQPENNQEAIEETGVHDQTNTEDYPKEEKKEKEDKLTWNYSGHIGKYPIKAQINYLESTHDEGTGAIRFPISGYYFYDTQNKKIPIEGEANGIGMIFLTAYIGGATESFDGEMTGDEMLGDFSGIWSNPEKTLDFELRSRY